MNTIEAYVMKVNFRAEIWLKCNEFTTKYNDVLWIEIKA